MSKRLQLLIDERELREIRRVARQRKTTVSELVRGAVREVLRQAPAANPLRKLGAVRRALKNAFLTGDIAQMLREIERGYEAPAE